nr:hypothetical protein [Tanacetum cinerariifolium]
MEEVGPSVIENPTNGSLCLEVDFKNDDDDMMIDAPSVRENKEEAGPSITEKPTNGSLHLELALENSDHDTMIAAPSVRDLYQLAKQVMTSLVKCTALQERVGGWEWTDMMALYCKNVAEDSEFVRRMGVLLQEMVAAYDDRVDFIQELEAVSGILVVVKIAEFLNDAL